MQSREEIQQTYLNELDNLSDCEDLDPGSRTLISPARLLRIQTLIKFSSLFTTSEELQRTLQNIQETDEQQGILESKEFSTDKIINSKNKYGKTLLAIASHHGWKEIVRALIEAKADLNAQDNIGNTALMIAVKREFLDIVKILLDAGAKHDIKCNKGLTALMWATQISRPTLLLSEPSLLRITQLLIEAGADVNSRCHKGRTPLMIAVLQAKKCSAHLQEDVNLITKVVKLLLEAKAEVNLKTQYDPDLVETDDVSEEDFEAWHKFPPQSALDFADGNSALCHLLLQHGADIDNPSAFLDLLKNKNKNIVDSSLAACYQMVGDKLQAEVEKISKPLQKSREMHKEATALLSSHDSSPSPAPLFSDAPSTSASLSPLPSTHANLNSQSPRTSSSFTEAKQLGSPSLFQQPTMIRQKRKDTDDNSPSSYNNKSSKNAM